MVVGQDETVGLSFIALLLRGHLLIEGVPGTAKTLLARTVARQLMAKNALAAHARDELGLTDELAARPLHAALASAATFTAGAIVPILTIIVVLPSAIVVCAVSLLCLVALGATAARAGGAPILVGAARVGGWGALAMAVTAAVGRLFGTAIG